MARFLRNRFVVLAAVAGLTLLAASVFAQSNPLPIPVNISTGAAVPTGLQSTVTFDARGVGTAANAGYYSRPVLVSSNTLGGLARGALRRSVPILALAAAIEGAGWVIDELTKQVMTQGVPGVPLGSASYCSMDYPTHCSATAEGFFGYTPGWSTSPLSSINGGQPCASSCTLLNATNQGFPIVWKTTPANAFNVNSGVAPAPVADAALGQVVLNNPGLWDSLLRNPDGSVNRNPDVMAASQALASELASTNPAVNPSPVGEWDTGQQGGPQQGTNQTALEFPAFCAWATKVCELADYLLDGGDDVSPDDDQEIEEIPLVLDQSWSSGFSGGSCPVPVSVTVMDAEVIFSYQPLCDLAAYIRPIVLAATALLCVMIIGGFRRAA